MKKSRKTIAMFAVIVLLVSNMMLLLSNISFASHSKVKVTFTPEKDSSCVLSEDGETLTYTCENDKTYSFNLKQNGENLKFTKNTKEEDGRFYDSYVVSNISTNENVYIATPEMAFDDIAIMYSGNSIGMWVNDNTKLWEGQKLIDMDDVDDYQFRIENRAQKEQPNNGDNGNNNGGNVDWANEEYDVDFGSASWVVKGKTVTATVEGKNITSGPVKLKGNEKIKLTGYDPKTMEAALIRENEQDFSERLKVDENNETWVINRNCRDFPNDIGFIFVVQRRTGSDDDQIGGEDKPQGNVTSVVNLNTIPGGSVKGAVIEINGYPINDQVEIGEELPAVNNAKYFYDANENDGKVKFTFSTLFIEKYVGKIKINNDEFDVTEDLLDYTDRTAWLNHYGHQMVTLEVNVDKADVYNVEVNVAENEGKDQWIGNFLWTDDEKEKDSDLYIGNSLLEVVKVTYEIDGKEVTVEEKDLKDDPYIEYDPYREVASLVVPEGAECTMRITPDYGYQVTSFGVNNNAIITGENISEFTFPIHKGNFHLGAEVTKVENEVDAKSEKVKSGEIEISDNEIDSGSVVLSVNDVNISGDKREKFEDVAGEYEIKSYLDIDLDKVIYKGSKEDVWSERIHELNDEATITLQLEEGVDGNNIIIVHNINDGDEYEIIEIESYDPKTNTITFKTKSFSNYAIAVKKDDNNNEEEQNDPEVLQEKYTIANGDDFVVVFSDNEGHEYKLVIGKLANLTDEELAKYDLTPETYAKAIEDLKERMKNYGTILEVYDITVADGEIEYTGELTFKIKLTEEMKKYNSFKLVCIDNEVIGDKDVVTLKIEGDYLVGNLYHLSNYVLVGSNVQENGNNSINPQTGDTIVITASLFTISLVGIVIMIRLNGKKTKVRKH